MKYKIDIYRVDGQWRWKMISTRNGKIVGASSEAFKNKAGVNKNLEIVTGYNIESFEKVSKDNYTYKF